MPWLTLALLRPSSPGGFRLMLLELDRNRIAITVRDGSDTPATGTRGIAGAYFEPGDRVAHLWPRIVRVLNG